MAILDEADYRILDILQKDGRITFSDLADQVNLSRSAVRERIKNMQDSGIIRGFTAIMQRLTRSLRVSIWTSKRNR